MTPQEHYRAAERLLDRAGIDGNIFETDNVALATLRAAQVHATLATAPQVVTIETDLAREAGRREAKIRRLQRDRDQAAALGRLHGGADALLLAADALPGGTPGSVRMMLRVFADQVRTGERSLDLPKEDA